MASTLQHRGPDEGGEYLSPDLHMVVTRLAIVDLKGGTQPVYGCSNEIACAYNGELYEQYELRQRLKRFSHRITSDCDSSLLPHCYEEWGPSFPEELRGMFAAALWDAREQRLLLIRDRLGIKPLYWTRTPDYIVFSSEIKAILASRLVAPQLDPRSVSDLFAISYPTPPRTMFESIDEVPPAHYVVIDRGSPPRPVRYWQAPFPELGNASTLSLEEARVEFRSKLERVVYSHLVSDVPVAAYLSGGIDSALVTALVKEVTGDPPATFSIGFDLSDYDESDQAAQVARHLGSKHHCLRFTSYAADYYPRAIWNLELPLQFPLGLPLQLLSAAVRENGYRVVLTGEGADEILGGYDCFRIDKLRRALDKPGIRWLRQFVYRRLYQWLGSPEGVAEHITACHRTSRSVASNFGGFYPPWIDVWATLAPIRESLLRPIAEHVQPITEPSPELVNLIRPNINRMHPLDAALAFEVETRLPSWILQICDRSSMANGVEARVPYLDHKITEFAARLPPSQKLSGFTEKSILRAAGRGLLPDSVLRRRKRPFYVPIKSWFFSSHSPDYVHHFLSERALRLSNLFEPSVVSRLISQLGDLKHNSLPMLQHEWALLLVLGTQLLHYQFVERLDDHLTPPPVQLDPSRPIARLA